MRQWVPPQQRRNHEHRVELRTRVSRKPKVYPSKAFFFNASYLSQSASEGLASEFGFPPAIGRVSGAVQGSARRS